MIDLHMHTNNSDGTDSTLELLLKAQNKNLEVISITDHDNCNAYHELNDIKKYYQGKIIIGCEFATSYHGRLIEILGYGFDLLKVEEFLNNYYTKDKALKSKQIIYDRFLNNIKKANLICPNAKEIIKENIGNKKVILNKILYEELLKYPQNKDILNEDIWTDFSLFYRKGLTNPQSKLFLNHAQFKPHIKDILTLIHDAHGIAFLAHPYQYQFSDTEDFIDKLYNEYDIDGIECFYPTFSKEQINYLLNFAQKRNLLISGGSDYHGKLRKNELGTGFGNLNINKRILENWPIKYYN